MLFSIVIPVYNVEKYLRNTIDSVLQQTYGDFELILVDDGSEDASPGICDEYGKKDSRIRVFHKENEGSNSARNVGIFEARGEYICLVDSDDRVADQWLETIHHMIVSAPSVPDLIVYGYIEVSDNTVIERPIHIEEGYYDKARLESEIYPRLINLGGKGYSGSLIFEVPWNKVYKKKLIQEHCCRNTEIKVSNDMAFAHECVMFAQDMVACDKNLYYYSLQNNTSLQRSYHPNLLINFKMLYLYMMERLGGLYPYIPDQLNALLSVWIKKGVNQELLFHIPISEAREHLKEGFKSSGILHYVQARKLPLKSQLRILLLRMKLYGLCLQLQKWANNGAK